MIHLKSLETKETSAIVISCRLPFFSLISELSATLIIAPKGVS